MVSDIENLHHNLHFALKRNSERDIPRGSVWNCVLKIFLITASERRGSLFPLLCLAHTKEIRCRLEQCLSQENSNVANFFLCIKLYLGMEVWFHAKNPKTKVQSSKTLIANTFQLIKDVVPRTDSYGDKVGQGWSLPKFHATTKFGPPHDLIWEWSTSLVVLVNAITRHLSRQQARTPRRELPAPHHR